MTFFFLITGPDHYWLKKASTILLQAIKTEVYLSAFNSFIHKCMEHLLRGLSAKPV